MAPSIFPPTGPSGSLSLPPCELPPKIATPVWFPADLPLPSGSYATESLPPAQAVNRAEFVVPGSLRAFVTFILAEWPKRGWVLGRGEAEENEVEDTFSRPPAEFGLLKAREEACSPGYVLLLLGYTENRSSGSPPGPAATNSG